MNKIKYLKRFAALCALIGLVLMPAAGADYAIAKSFWVVANFTNNPATATNLAQVIDVTQFPDFALIVKGGLTNPSAGTLDIKWDVSADNTYPVQAGVVAPLQSGWFSVPLTNNGTNFNWTTNITVNAVGYWRLTWLTNAAVQHMTNITIRGYVKPKRTASDF